MNPILHAFMPTLSPVLRNVLIFFVSVALLWSASVVHANLGSAPVSPPPVSGLKTSSDPQQTAGIRERYGKLPLQFEANQGQAQSQAKFIARGHGYQLALLPGKALLRLRQTATPSQPAAPDTDLGIHFIGANNDAVVQGQDALPGKSNYFVGNDPAQWRANVPTFAKVQYQALYPGVDLLYYGQQGQLEYDFIVAPGADVRRIQMAFDGVQSVRIARNGELVLRTATGVVRQLKPVIYQTIDGQRRTVQGRYVLQGRQRVGFLVGKYDHSQPLVIDPILEYSTFIGGTSSEQGLGIVVDKDGNAYITGDTFSSDFPVAGAIQPTKNNLTDVFVLKLNASGSAIVYATYLGGISSDTGNGIAIDAEGNAYVTGFTASTDFPITNGALQPTSKGLTDAFIAKLNAAGSALTYSSYFGGNGRDIATAIALDSTGSAYITGRTDSTDLPATGLQTNRSGNLAYKTINRGDAWTASGNGLIGATTYAIGINPAFPNIIFLSTTSGTYRSINEGAGWQLLTLPPPITNGFPLVLSIAFNPKNPSTVYLGGFGVFKSTDDGMTWATKNTGLNLTNVNAIAVDPKQPDTVYVGTSVGLYKSTDGGENWTAMNFGLNYQPQTVAQIRITELVIDPNNTATVYAGTAFGVFKTTDGANSWMGLSGGLPTLGQFPAEVTGLVLDATNPAILYVSTLGAPGGVYKSLNGGLSWAVSSNGLSPTSTPGAAAAPVNVIVIDPLNAGTLYAGTNSAGVFKSTDAGANWSTSSRDSATTTLQP